MLKNTNIPDDMDFCYVLEETLQYENPYIHECCKTMELASKEEHTAIECFET